jgi:hypothetical protein
MRINDIILDEGIADALGSISRGIGAVAGGAASVWDAGKKGYDSVRGSAPKTDGTKVSDIMHHIDALDTTNKARFSDMIRSADPKVLIDILQAVSTLSPAEKTNLIRLLSTP